MTTLKHAQQAFEEMYKDTMSDASRKIMIDWMAEHAEEIELELPAEEAA